MGLGLPIVLWGIIPGVHYTIAAIIAGTIVGVFAYFACRYDWICNPNLSVVPKKKE